MCTLFHTYYCLLTVQCMQKCVQPRGKFKILRVIDIMWIIIWWVDFQTVTHNWKSTNCHFDYTQYASQNQVLLLHFHSCVTEKWEETRSPVGSQSFSYTPKNNNITCWNSLLSEWFTTNITPLHVDQAVRKWKKDKCERHVMKGRKAAVASWLQTLQSTICHQQNLWWDCLTLFAVWCEEGMCKWRACMDQ